MLTKIYLTKMSLDPMNIQEKIDQDADAYAGSAVISFDEKLSK